MPKTNEKDAYYFPHDCNARNDPKILALRSVFGAEGYGVYWMMIEILREQPDYKLQVTKYLYNALAMQMQVQKERLQEIVEACCNEFVEGGSPLLVNDGQYIYSESLLRRMERVDTVSEARRAAARKRWETGPCKVPEGEAGWGTGCKGDANAEHEQSKENKRKENKRKSDQRTTPHIPPSPSSAVAAYLDRVNPSASQQSLELLAAYERDMGTEVCVRAIDVALDNRKTNWAYIKAILQRWTEEKVKCIADIEALEARHEREKKIGGKGKYHPGAGATVPQPGKYTPEETRARERAEMEQLRNYLKTLKDSEGEGTKQPG